MRRRGSVGWQSRSLDLKPQVFFFWTVLKDHIYRLKLKTIPEVKHATFDKLNEINVEMSQKVCKSFAVRFNYVLNLRGGHFKHVK